MISTCESFWEQNSLEFLKSLTEVHVLHVKVSLFAA